MEIATISFSLKSNEYLKFIETIQKPIIIIRDTKKITKLV